MSRMRVRTGIATTLLLLVLCGSLALVGSAVAADATTDASASGPDGPGPALTSSAPGQSSTDA